MSFFEFAFQKQPRATVSILFLLIALILPPTSSDSRADASYGVDLPHGSITFYGPDYGDNRRVGLEEMESSTRSAPGYVTSFKPSEFLNR